MQNRRERNLQRRRRKLIFISFCSGLAMSAIIIGVFFGVVAGFGKWPDHRTIGYLIQDTAPRTDQVQLAEVSGEASGQNNVPESPEPGNRQEAGQTELAASAGETDIAEEPIMAQETVMAEEPIIAQETDIAEEPAIAKETDTTAAAIAVAVGEVNSVYVKLIAVGDNLVHRSVSMSGLQADGSYNYSYNFSKIAEIVREADVAVINQEAVIGGNELGIQGYPCFNCRTEMADELVRTGFDVVLGANNHILDQGAGAVLHMIRYFQTNYPQITLLGLHDSWETRDQLSIVECKGIRIAMINYTDLLNIPSAWYGQEYLTDYLDYDRLAALIQQAKNASDFVIVFPHWGTEYNLGTDAKQQEEVAFLAAQGVDLVIGTHPHVVEPVQYMTRPDGGKMLIYYSLGNYQSIQNLEATLIGGMAEVVIKKNYAGTSISDFNMRFLATDFRMSGGFRDYYDVVTTYPWEQYSRELAQSSWVFNDNPDYDVDYMFWLKEQMEAQVAAERQAAGFN